MSLILKTMNVHNPSNNPSLGAIDDVDHEEIVTYYLFIINLTQKHFHDNSHKK